jgi:lipoate-protein ligase A
MPSGRSCFDPPLPAAEALARGRIVAASVDTACPVAVYGAPLELAAVVLGAFQHAPHALTGEALSALALPVVRRATGGSAVWAGEGVLYLAVGLRDRSALMSCPAGKLLNRNVRGLLAGARALGVPTHYFGRDFLSFGVDPGIYVGWSESEPDGRVLLEAFVALDTAFALPAALVGYPTAAEPALRGKTPTTLRAAGLAAKSADEVLRALADGYARGHGVAFEARALDAAELDAAASVRASLPVDVASDGGLCWSAPREEAIGFVSAGARLDEWGAIAALELGGDFMQRSSRGTALRDALVGIIPDAPHVGAAVDTVYGREPGALEGVRSLHTLRDAILDACERARISPGARP